MRDTIAGQRQFVAQYELLRLLGEGAHCTVYEARDTKSGERVALKRLNRVGPASASQFKREFRIVQGLHHPNLVELRELFESDGCSRSNPGAQSLGVSTSRIFSARDLGENGFSM